jgi:hypothetical protein
MIAVHPVWVAAREKVMKAPGKRQKEILIESINKYEAASLRFQKGELRSPKLGITPS